MHITFPAERGTRAPTIGVAAMLLAAAALAACAGGTPKPPASATAAQPAPSATPTAPVPPTVTRPATVGPTTPGATETPAPAASSLPAGFPLDPALRTDLVIGTPGARTIVAGGGPGVHDVSAAEQASDDPVRANASGWDCRVHVEYEGTPAVDWYVQAGQPVRATMDGEAILFVNTTANAFDYYGVPREPYIGNPDRPRAPVSPFPGPGGGMGVYVSVINAQYRTDYGHFDVARTVANVPAAAFAGGYSGAFDYAAVFATPRDFRLADQIARWPVRRGDVIGYTGDSGYSEAPHLHYQIARLADGQRLCPTGEAGFADGGWLFR